MRHWVPVTPHEITDAEQGSPIVWFGISGFLVKGWWYFHISISSINANLRQ
jgi:hypothetical protein